MLNLGYVQCDRIGMSSRSPMFHVIATTLFSNLIAILAPFVVLLVQVLYGVSSRAQPQGFQHWMLRGFHTLGRLTSGMTVTFRALGASLGAASGSPPGWYLYLPSVEPVSQGMPDLAMPTSFSEVDLVGVRPRIDGISRCSDDLTLARIMQREAYRNIVLLRLERRP